MSGHAIFRANTPGYGPSRQPRAIQHPVLREVMEKSNPPSWVWLDIFAELCALQSHGVELTVPIVTALVECAVDKRSQIQPQPLPPPEHPPIVYYVSLGGLIKIGTTTNFRSRMAQFRPERVLAVELGGADQERDRHRQFATLRSHHEWFRSEPPLTEFVAALPVPDGLGWMLS